MQAATKIIHTIPTDPQTGSVTFPIYQTSTFVQSAPGVHKGYDYGRSNNPTRAALESVLAELENGECSAAFSSGLAAIDAVVKLLSSGDEILAVQDIYGGAYRLFTTVYQQLGISVRFVDTSQPDLVHAALGPKTKLVWIESPTNPTLKVSDIEAIARVCQRAGVLLCVDNTFCSPVAQQPLDLGADIVVHSATKYLGGHSDLIAGAVVCRHRELGDKIKYIQNASGAVLGPFECFLVLRGIETLDLRIGRVSDTAQQVAEFLLTHEAVRRVYYPGLPNHPNYDVARRQTRYYGGMISFDLQVDTEQAATALLQQLKLFKLAESLGGAKSLSCLPSVMTHKSIPREQRIDNGVTDSLIRLSIGLEAASDLIFDLNEALSLTIEPRPQQEVPYVC